MIFIVAPAVLIGLFYIKEWKRDRDLEKYKRENGYYDYASGPTVVINPERNHWVERARNMDYAAQNYCDARGWVW